MQTFEEIEGDPFGKEISSNIWLPMQKNCKKRVIAGNSNDFNHKQHSC